jgi:hypothetical protein
MLATIMPTTVARDRGLLPQKQSNKAGIGTKLEERHAGAPSSGIKLAPTTRRTSVRRLTPVGVYKRRSADREVRRPDRTSRQIANGSDPNVATDGSSGGRSGRQFTVGNVGNNGMIYLR